jgi:phosphopantothenoylcysteine decarboxylase / phosphopantothenate---cysteine ligase
MDDFWLSLYQPIFNGKKVLLGVTGSIAAVKSMELARKLKALGAQVRVVLTDSAQKFVTPLSFETFTGEPCLTSLWEGTHGTKHIDLARWPDIVLIAPATANTIAKLAHGFAEDLLTTELLAYTGPLVIAPAMNPSMWSHPATQANTQTLLSRGARLLGPVIGDTACGETGAGRMLEVQELLEQFATHLAPPNTKGKALVTLGPTRSRYDPVRYLTNRSSGRMGSAMAFALAEAGYDVHIVAGPCNVPLPRQATVTYVETAEEMLDACTPVFLKSEVLVATAAVLDYRFESTKEQKDKRGEANLAVQLAPSVDVLMELSKRRRPEQKLIGFAAETTDWLIHGRNKLSKKACDAVFVNPVAGRTGAFDAQDNQGWLLQKGSEEEIRFDRASKANLARDIIQALGL